MFQRKEQKKTPEEGPSKLEISSLTKKAFKVMTIKMLHKLRRRLDEHSEKQIDLKKKVTEIKNTLQGINTRLDDKEE